MSLTGLPVRPPEPTAVDSLFTSAVRSPGAGGNSQNQERDALFQWTAEADGGDWHKRAEELSVQYQQTHRLDRCDAIVNGFCDLLGDGVLIHRATDEKLDQTINKAHKKLRKASDPITALLALGLLVSDLCGSSGIHAFNLESRTAKIISDHSKNGSVPLGVFFSTHGKSTQKVQGVGLSRHRALTFKLLAEATGVTECSLERDPQSLTAWNSLSLGSMSYVIDLMHDPGALYEADSAKQKEYVRLLASDFRGLGASLSTQDAFAGKVPRAPWHVEVSAIRYDSSGTNCLGKGGFGEVYKGMWAGATVAVKVVKNRTPSDYDVLDFVLEIALLSRLNHPNVMRFWRGCAVTENGTRSLLMLTEFVEKGGLCGVLHGHGGPRLKSNLTTGHVLVLCLGIARGMNYLHFCHILHLDLKSPNVLLDSAWTPKLCDFGLARISAQQIGNGLQTTLRGISPVWAPPEMFDDKADSMTEKADIYSFGIVFFEIACRQLPFQDVSQRNLPQIKFEGVLPTVPNWVPDDFKALIKACCAHKPRSRPSMAGVLARLQEHAQARKIDVAEVEMPTWDADDASAAREAEAIKTLKEQKEKAQKERLDILAKLEATRDQRRRLQEIQFGGEVVAEEGLIPKLSSSPRHAGSPTGGSIPFNSQISGKQTCCVSQ